MAVNRPILIASIMTIALLTTGVLINRVVDGQRDFEARQADLAKLSDLVDGDIDLDGLSDFEKAVTIRHYIYEKHSLGKGGDSLDGANLSQAWRQITTGQSPVVCGWLALIYVAALESQGISARYVGIFSNTEMPYDSHASVEIYIDGQWVISDPTFNIMFMSGDDYLSWSDLYSGNSYSVTTNGQGEPTQWDNYYIGLDDLMKYVIIHSEPLTLLPADWGNGLAYETDSATYQFLRSQRQ